MICCFGGKCEFKLEYAIELFSKVSQKLERSSVYSSLIGCFCLVEFCQKTSCRGLVCSFKVCSIVFTFVLKIDQELGSIIGYSIVLF